MLKSQLETQTSSADLCSNQHQNLTLLSFLAGAYIKQKLTGPMGVEIVTQDVEPTPFLPVPITLRLAEATMAELTLPFSAESKIMVQSSWEHQVQMELNRIFVSHKLLKTHYIKLRVPFPKPFPHNLALVWVTKVPGVPGANLNLFNHRSHLLPVP